MEPTSIPLPLLRCWEEKTVDENGKTVVKPVSLMKPCEIPQFRTVFFSRCMELYNTWKLFKQTSPLGEGWGNERGITCTILRLLEVENNQYDAWQRDLEDEKRKK